MAETKRVYIKILSKNKDGCLVHLPGVGKQTMSWEEFEAGLEIDPENPHKAFFKAEFQEKQEKAWEHIQAAQVFFLIGNGKKDDMEALQSNMIMIEELKKASEVSGVPLQQIMVMFKKQLHSTFSGMLKHGVGIGGRARDMLDPEHFEMNQKNLKKLEKQREKEEKTEKVDNDMMYKPFANLKVAAK